MEKEEQLKALDVQMIGTALFIVTLFISLFLAYNQKLNLMGCPILDDKEAASLNYLNRLAILALVVFFFFISLQDADLGNEEKKEANLQATASFLTVIAALIVLYVGYLNLNKVNNIDVSLNNPEL